MTIAPVPDDEPQRVAALRRYEILDTEPEAPFDDLVQLAATICRVPIAQVSLVDSRRQWFKAKTGVGICETSRDIAFSAHVILQRDIFEVQDAHEDERFSTNPLVKGAPGIRFYAGVPLVTGDGYAVGTLCVIDRVPRRLSPAQQQALSALGRQVLSQLDLRLHNRHLAQHLAAQKQSDSMQARFLFAFEHAIDGMAILDQAGRFTYMNRAHAAMYGYEPADLIGKSWKQLYAPEWAAKIDRVFFPLLMERGHWHGETIGTKKLGASISTEITLTLFPEQSHRDNWLLWTCRDQTVQKTARDERLEAQARLQAVLDAATEVSIIAMNLEGVITVFNRGAEWMLAYDAGEMIGTQTPLVIHLPGEIQARGRELSERFGRPVEGFHVLVEEVRRGTHEEREWTYVRKDGQHIPVTLLVTAMRDAYGYITGYLGIARDLTETKQAEAALRASEDRYQVAVRGSSDGIWDWNILTNEMYFSPRFKELLGYDDHEIENVFASLSCRLHPDDEQSLTAAVDAHLTKGAPYDVEYRLRTKAGHYRWFRSRGQAVWNDRGLAIRMAGSVTDITEKKIAEKALADAAVELAGRNAELQQARDHALAATKAKSEFLASMSHEIRTPMNAIIGMADLLQETALSQVQQEYVDRFSRAAASLLDLINDILDLSKIEAGHVELESIPFDLHDLVDRMAEAMAVRAHAKKIDLLAFVHPEVPAFVLGDPTRLRQVLVNLVGNAVKFTEQGEVVIKVEPAGDQSAPGGLRFSISDTGIGIPTGKISTIFESFTQVDSSTTRKYGGTGLGLSISKRIVGMMGGHIEVASVLGQGSTFSFVLHLSTSQAPETISILPPITLQGRRILVVEDNDTNRMIVREHLARQGASVIESSDAAGALRALDDAHRQNEPIDLAILDCYLPDQHGMDLAQTIRHRPDGASLPLVVHTAEVRRATARRTDNLNIAGYLYKPTSRKRLLASVALALQQSATASRAPKPTLNHPEPAGHSPLTILLVEDLEDNRDLIGLFLRGMPYRLDLAENGAIAVQKFHSGTYDLVLMDIQMPIMDGYQATSAIRAWEQKQGLEGTPIIALTANAFKEDIEKSQAAGCTAHLMKPIKKQTLLDAILRHARPRTDKAA
jgi:PAS domain S-box-containing protein